MSRGITERLQALGWSERTLAQGGLVFHRGDPVEHLFLVLDGTIELTRHRADGGMVVLQRATPNAVLAEASVFSERYHCDASAVAPSVLLAVPIALVRAQLVQSPEFAEAWATYLAHQVQAARLRSEILSLKTVAQRLDAWLLSHGERLPAKGAWKSLAHEIGISPEALYRELSRRKVAEPGEPKLRRGRAAPVQSRTLLLT